MNKTQCVLTAFVFTAVVSGLGTMLPPDKFTAALHAAEANESTADGEKFDMAVGMQFGKTHGNTVAKCTEGAEGTNLATLNLLMKLDSDGNVIDTLVFPETTVAKCLQSAVAHDKFPKPAHADYWVRVELSLKP